MFVCGTNQNFCFGTPLPPGVTPLEVQFLGIVIELTQYYNEKCTSIVDNIIIVHEVYLKHTLK